MAQSAAASAISSERLLEDARVSRETLTVPRSQVRHFKQQPRTFFEQAKIAELATGIRAVGQLEAAKAIVIADHDFLEPAAPGVLYELIDGERRDRACELAGIPTIDIVLYKVKNRLHQLALSLAANFGREGHTPIEMARAFGTFRDEGLEPAAIAAIVGVAVSAVENYLRLLGLTEELQDRMDPNKTPPERRLSFPVAKQLVKIRPEKQAAILERIERQGGTPQQAGIIVQAALRIPSHVALGVRVRAEKPVDNYRRVLRVVEEVARQSEAGIKYELAEILERRSGGEVLSLRRSLGGTIDRLEQILTSLGGRVKK